MCSLAGLASVYRLALGFEMSNSEAISTYPIRSAELMLVFMRHCLEFGTEVERMPFSFARNTLVLSTCNMGGEFPVWLLGEGFLVGRACLRGLGSQINEAEELFIWRYSQVTLAMFLPFK